MGSTESKTYSETCNLAGFFSLNWFHHHWSLALSTRAPGPLSRGNWMLERLLLLTVWTGRKEAVWTSEDGSVATNVCCASWPLVQGRPPQEKNQTPLLTVPKSCHALPNMLLTCAARWNPVCHSRASGWVEEQEGSHQGRNAKKH